MVDNMDTKKEILNSNQMIGELIIRFVLWGFIFGISYNILYSIIRVKFEEKLNFTLMAIISLILQFLMLLAIYTFSNKSIAKKYTIYNSDIPKVIKTIGFIIIVILLIQVLSVFISINSVIDEVIQKDISLQIREKLFLSYLYNEEEMSIYQIEKEKAIKEVKKQAYQFLIIYEIGLCIIYISSIYLEKRSLYKIAIENL